jgi:hypothetical protein
MNISRKIPGIKGGMDAKDVDQAEEVREEMESDNLEE